MAVFRVEKNENYTVMSNFHLRDKALSLKAKGLLSQMLSLPEEWDFTLSGLAKINRESKDAIRTAVQELEQAGYIDRRQTQDASGKFAGNEYIIHEEPVTRKPGISPDQETPGEDSAAPLLDFPTTEKPSTEKPSSENPTQLNKDILSKDIKKKKEKENRQQLPEEALRALVRDSIQRIAAPAWSRDDKNRLFVLVVELYSPTREVRKAHPMRTKRSIDRTFDKLVEWAGADPRAMADIVDCALANGWQGIQPPGGGVIAGKPPDPTPVDYF